VIVPLKLFYIIPPCDRSIKAFFISFLHKNLLKEHWFGKNNIIK